MNYTIIADPIRGWKYNNNGQKINAYGKRKSGMTRVNKYRKMLKSAKINFQEIFIPAGAPFAMLSEELKERCFTYQPWQDLYVFLLP